MVLYIVWMSVRKKISEQNAAAAAAVGIMGGRRQVGSVATDCSICLTDDGVRGCRDVQRARSSMRFEVTVMNSARLVTHVYAHLANVSYIRTCKARTRSRMSARTTDEHRRIRVVLASSTHIWGQNTVKQSPTAKTPAEMLIDRSTSVFKEEKQKLLVFTRVIGTSKYIDTAVSCRLYSSTLYCTRTNVRTVSFDLLFLFFFVCIFCPPPTSA